MSALTPADIDAVCDLVYDLCGICWDQEKSYLIESRLAAIMTRRGCRNYAEFAQQVRSALAPELNAEVIDAVTTHETRWFRDAAAFDALKFKIVPELIDAKASTPHPRRLRIWSAGCSTGQEPYSIAIALAEMLDGASSWDVQILGTDVSVAAIEQANRGAYGTMEIGRGMDPARLQKHFAQAGDGWRVSDEIRSLCSFAVQNLHQGLAAAEPFDIIFCRNVTIYFSDDDRRAVFERLAQSLAPDGWVLTGSSESLAPLGPRWAPQFHCRANCYRPNLLASAITPAQ